MLMTWYSGWYNGLAKKHFFHPSRAKRLEHEVIVYCKANQGIRVIDAIAVIFKDERVKARHPDEGGLIEATKSSRRTSTKLRLR